MPKPPSRPEGGSPAASTLAARVERRVSEATDALSRRRSARHPRPRTATPKPSAAELERASLGSVFRELGDVHRRYRERTGQAGTPELRAAARAFKAAPTLPALVTVAGFLDELGLLAW